MTKYLSLLSLALVTLWACQGESTSTNGEQTRGETPTSYDNADGAATKADRLPVEVKKISKVSADCQSPDDLCARVELQYPYLAPSVGPLAESVNEYIRNAIAQYAESTPGAKLSTEQVADAFVKEFETLLKNNRDIPSGSALDVQGEILYENDRLLSISLPIYSYVAGAAHPNAETELASFDKKSGKKMAYEDLFADRAALETTIQEQFMQVIKGKTQEALTLDDFFWGEGFSLPKNFVVKKDSMLFLYNPYEAAAYVFGDISIELPLEDLQKMLKPGILSSN
ncbi:MAG: DUF3298 domain-containing protein [Bacteroidota bacterium]